MTDIEKKALEQAVAAAGRRMQDYAIMAEENVLRQSIEAHARAIEQHEAFKLEVSDRIEACRAAWPGSWAQFSDTLERFIIAKPVDPLVEVFSEMFPNSGDKEGMGQVFRAAIEARGGRIVWEGE